MVSDRLSVIISAEDGVGSLERCLDSLRLQRPEPDQVVIVHNGALDAPTGHAGVGNCELIRIKGPPGIGAARNAGANASNGEILAFIAADTVVRPGWAKALRRAFAEGASLAGGRIDSAKARSLAGWYGSRWRPHDEEASNGFLPFVSGAHMAIRRDLFIRLGGFDDQRPLSEDVDLSLRAQLAGYPVVFVPDAELAHEPATSAGGVLKHRVRRARADRITEVRFRQFPFMGTRREPGVARVLASSTANQVMGGTGSDTRRPNAPLLRAAVAAAGRLGTLATDFELATGVAPWPSAIAYRDPEQHNTSAPLQGSPSFLLLGDDRAVIALLRLACEGGDELILAPPGLEGEAVRSWDQPAPWSLRLVRLAVRAGWSLPLETAAMRVEREQPRTWGDAFLTLHRVHAWAHGRPRFGLASHGFAGRQLAERLPGVPIVVAGHSELGGERVVLRVTRRRLVRDRHAVGAELSRLSASGDPER